MKKLLVAVVVLVFMVSTTAQAHESTYSEMEGCEDWWGQSACYSYSEYVYDYDSDGIMYFYIIGVYTHYQLWPLPFYDHVHKSTWGWCYADMSYCEPY